MRFSTRFGSVIGAITRINSGQSSGSGASHPEGHRLPTEISPTMLRGIRSDRALRCFGQIWTSGDIGQAVLSPEETYDLSEPVEGIDDFISHDWKTGRFLKFVSLCVIYNFEAALCASVVVGVALGILQTDGVLSMPKPEMTERWRLWIGGVEYHTPSAGCWCTLVCPIVFLFFFFWWQHVRTIILRCPRLLFVDRCCVNQGDEKQKRKAIVALGGFLKMSRRLVVLWSPRYFTRLWCTYEIATWMHLSRDLRHSLLFMPVSLAFGLTLLAGTTWSMCVMWGLVAFATNSPWDHGRILASVLLFSSHVVMHTVPVHILRHVAHDLRLMLDQLARFSVEKSSCFCCQHCHAHPETGARLPCDRQLVYATLHVWFTSVAAMSDEQQRASLEANHHLQVFNRAVRSKFADAVKRKAGGTRVSYRHSLMTVVPLLWAICDCIPRLAVLDHTTAIRFMGNYLVLALTCLPCFVRVTLQVMYCMDKFALQKSFVCDLVASVVATIFISLLIFAVALPLVLVTERVDSWTPQLAFSILLCLVTLFMFRRSCYVDDGLHHLEYGLHALERSCSMKVRSDVPKDEACSVPVPSGAEDNDASCDARPSKCGSVVWSTWECSTPGLSPRRSWVSGGSKLESADEVVCASMPCASGCCNVPSERFVTDTSPLGVSHCSKLSTERSPPWVDCSATLSELAGEKTLTLKAIESAESMSPVVPNMHMNSLEARRAPHSAAPACLRCACAQDQGFFQL